MITFLVLLIVLIPICFVIYKKAAKEWKKADTEEQKQLKYEKELDELDKDEVIQNELSGLQKRKPRRMIEINGES